MTNYEIVKKIIGPIKPVGDTEVDNERFENLRETIEVVDVLVSEIEYVAGRNSSNEYSTKRASDFATEFLIALKNRILNI